MLIAKIHWCSVCIRCGGTFSAAPSDHSNADNSGGEIDSPPPAATRFNRRPRSMRPREVVLKDINDLQIEATHREEEIRIARQRKADLLYQLDRLRGELEDGRFRSCSPSPMNVVSSSSLFSGISSPPAPPHLPPPSSQYWASHPPQYAGPSTSLGPEIHAADLSSSSSHTYSGAVSAYYASPPTPPADSSYFNPPPTAPAAHVPSASIYPNTQSAWSQSCTNTASTVWPGGC